MNPETELEFLMNPALYHKHIKKKIPISKEELKFYRRRILQMTRDMFKDNAYPSPVGEMFEAYIKVAIDYLKTEDTKDIIQEEYAQLEADLDISIPASLSIMDATKDMFNTPIRTIKDFVTITKSGGTPPAPEQKVIELTDPKLKMKGVKQKKKL